METTILTPESSEKWLKTALSHRLEDWQRSSYYLSRLSLGLDWAKAIQLYPHVKIPLPKRLTHFSDL